MSATIAPVVGGQPTAACDWPSTVDINGCTGTLIHPRVVTTAAHCLNGSSAKITFTAGRNMPGSFSLTGKCKAGATGSSGGGTSRDWAYCVLPEDMRVQQFQITPPLVGCEADRFLKVGASAWVVGFGTTGTQRNDNGIKREVEVKINKIANGTIDIGDKNVGACHGDSGGPIYMKLTDGTHDWGYRVFGSTSSAGGNCDCTCSTLYVNIAQHVKAIEQNEKIDVTPCTDADGKWAPTADCKEFQSDPQNATGTYPMCSVAVTHDPIATCDGMLPPAGGSSGAGRGGVAGAAGKAAAGAGGGAAGAAGIGNAGRGAAGGGVGGSMLAIGGNAASAGSGALQQPNTAGAIGTLTAAAQAAGGPATTFNPGAAVDPSGSHGCQAGGALGDAQRKGWWLLSQVLVWFVYRSRQRRRTAAVRLGC